MVRGCNNCLAFFEKQNDEEVLQVLRNHLEQCAEDKHYTNDPNIDGFYES